MSNFTDYSPTADLTIGVFGILLGSCTIVANTLVIAVISKFEKRTNSELIFLNIAVIDVVGGLDAIVAFIILLAKRTFFDFYFIDDVICQMLAITWRVASVVTPLMLSLTSLGRFLAVFTPHRYEGMFSKRNVIVCLGLFWTISSVGGTMHLYKLENTRMEPSWGYCDYRLIEMYTPLQTKVIVTALYTIPLVFSTVLLVFCNFAICVKLLQMRFKAQKRMDKKISVANGLGAALQTNIAVADASAARRITATETPAQKSIYRDRINTNVFELNVVLKDSMHCGIAFDSPGGSLVSTPESSRRCSPQLSKSKRLRVCSYSPSPHNRLNTSPLSPTLEPHRRCGSPSQIISASRLSPRLAHRNNRTRASITSSTSVVARFRKSFFVSASTSSIDISGRLTPDSMNRTIATTARVKKFIKRKKKETGRRELNIVMVTVLFSLNFVTWNCILLFYYFSYAVSPSSEVFNTIARDNKVFLTYLNGWFYYATFLTSSVNPIIHFVCNSKIRAGFKQIHDKIVSGFDRKFAACNCA